MNGNPVVTVVAWTPDCGALHVEENPTTVTLECPDGLTGWTQ